MADDAPLPRLTLVEWLICSIAAIGFAFDIYELLMAPLVFPDALRDLAGYVPGTPKFTRWVGALFIVPALLGGIFGLLGGYLTDRFGRRRVLTWSILIYAISAFCAGFSTNLWMLLFFRTTTFIGVCVEFVAAVAWLAELFDDPRRREKVLGYTQAFSSFGGLLVAVAYGLMVLYANDLPAVRIPGFLEGMLGSIQPGSEHQAWRYTLMSGIIPAIPLIVIRPFLPESPKWTARRAAGTLRRPSIAQLFSPELRRTTIVTTLMFACSYGVAFGTLQQIPQIVRGLDTVKATAAAKTEGMTPEQARPIIGDTGKTAAANYTKAQELGGLVGRFILAMIIVHFVSRRALLRVFVVPAMILIPLIFYGFSRLDETIFFATEFNWIPGFHDFAITLLGIGIFVAGLLTVAQFSFWGNYLPHVYPMHLRGTGESFAANIGGRMLGTPFMYVTHFLVTMTADDKGDLSQLALMAGLVAFVLMAANFGLSFLLPEPSGEIDE